jgi:hypothetical protein
LHEEDQKETIIGVPASRRLLVFTASPLVFSTVTEGTWAIETTAADTRRVRIKTIFLIVLISIKKSCTKQNAHNHAKIIKPNRFPAIYLERI